MAQRLSENGLNAGIMSKLEELEKAIIRQSTSNARFVENQPNFERLIDEKGGKSALGPVSSYFFGF